MATPKLWTDRSRAERADCCIDNAESCKAIAADVPRQIAELESEIWELCESIEENEEDARRFTATADRITAGEPIVWVDPSGRPMFRCCCYMPSDDAGDTSCHHCGGSGRVYLKAGALPGKGSGSHIYRDTDTTERKPNSGACHMCARVLIQGEQWEAIAGGAIHRETTRTGLCKPCAVQIGRTLPVSPPEPARTSDYVRESERAMRRALDSAKEIAPSVTWEDTEG